MLVGGFSKSEHLTNTSSSPVSFCSPHFDSKHEEVEEVELEKLIPFRIMGLVFSRHPRSATRYYSACGGRVFSELEEKRIMHVVGSSGSSK